MEASVRLLTSSSSSSSAAATAAAATAAAVRHRLPRRNPNTRNHPLLALRGRPPFPRPKASFPSPSPSPRLSTPAIASLLSLSHSFASSPTTKEWIFSPDSGPKEASFLWDRPDSGIGDNHVGFSGENGAIWTVVLLGWLGAEHKHLKKYAAMYHSKGIRSVRFVVPVKELLGFDLGRTVEEKIAELAQQLVSWCSETEKDGRCPRLLFHTFSNTGWLAYGAILENLQSRKDIIERIKGCIVDSGPAPEINPQVWAAGFCAALLKKRSLLTSSSDASIRGGKFDGNNDRLNANNSRPPLIETIVLSLLEKFFSIALKLPDINRRLSKTISILSEYQPLCPQLYLYSSADKVIPVQSIEKFVEQQKALGIDVYTHDFRSSPHVDHFRSYPDIYSAKVNEFLKICCSATV